MFHVPEKDRIVTGRQASDSSFGNNGAFQIAPLIRKRKLFIIASDGLEWEHVSLHAWDGKQTLTPYWDEMVYIKNIFWDTDDWVIQYHPSEKDYVNNHPNVLHLWRPIRQILPVPPSQLVGIRI